MMPEPPRVLRVLDYQTPKPSASYRFLPALLLCLPGISCWVVVLTNAIPIGFGGLMLLWALAIVTALWSFVLYAPPPWRIQPWYVWVCLTLNFIGLAYSVLVFVTLF